MPAISSLSAREILDSRGTPTVEVTAVLDDGSAGVAGVPSGASTGSHEALELRDRDQSRYGGQGVLRAIANVAEAILPAVRGRSAEDQEGLDARLVELDGTFHKSKLGANATLGVSLAVARAAAVSRRVRLDEHLRSAFRLSPPSGRLPVPLANVFNGGRHASTNFDLQEVWAVPSGIPETAEQVRAVSEVAHSLRGVLQRHGLDTDVGDEGGFAPNVRSLDEAFELVVEAIDGAGYAAGSEVSLGMDAGASTFFQPASGRYHLGLLGRDLGREELCELYAGLAARYPIRLIEDPFGEDDWDGWAALRAHPKLGGVKLIGDDLFTTNVTLLAEGIRRGVADGTIIKPNQIGTLSEAVAAARLAQQHGYVVIVSHRSGETNDDSIVDLAAALGADYLKIGAPVRGERVAKYNRLLALASHS